MHVEISQLIRAALALGFGACVIGFLMIINKLRRDMTGEAQMARYIALLAGCFAGAVGTAEQVREVTPLGIRVYATAGFLAASLVALYHTRREVRMLRRRDDQRGQQARRHRS